MNQGNIGEAFDLYERVAKSKLFKLGDADIVTLEAFNNLAVVWSILRKTEKDTDRSSSMHFEMGEDFVSNSAFGIKATATSVYSPERIDGFNLTLKGLYAKLMVYRERFLGNDHPDTLKTAVGYADLLHDMREFESANKLYERVLKAREEANGSSSPSTLAIVDKLANVLYDQKKYDKANEMYQRVLDARKAMDTLSGKEHMETLSTTNNFANLLLTQGMLDLARDMYERSLKGYEKKHIIQKHSKVSSIVLNRCLLL